MSGSHAWQVAILTHESTEIPFEETIANLLTQFFVSLGVRLHTSILVEGLESLVGQKRGQTGDRLTVVDHRGYKKECVASTTQFLRQDSEVVIALCHGMRSSAMGPARLCFSCNGRLDTTSKNMVYAKKNEIQPGTVTLHSVIGDCKLAILLVCQGAELLQTYIQAYGDQPHPDILICSGGPVIGFIAVEIYMVLLVNILDSQIDVRGSDNFIDKQSHIPLLPNVVYTNVRAAIEKIFQIVKLFKDDHTGFWRYLQHVGCVTDNADEKDRQELPYPRARLGPKSRFRVYGRTCTYDMAVNVLRIFQDFKNIQLIYHDAGKKGPTTMDYRSVSDIQWPAGQDDKIDRFLKRYKQSNQATGRPAPMSLSGLLIQLQKTDN